MRTSVARSSSSWCHAIPGGGLRLRAASECNRILGRPARWRGFVWWKLCCASSRTHGSRLDGVVQLSTMLRSRFFRRWQLHVLLVVCAAPAWTTAADRPQWGQAWSRNMASDETNLPDTFDPGTGLNIKWSAELGSQSYASPVVASGRVLIGTNNDRPRDARHHGDRAVLLCLAESDGRLLWQFVVPKLSEDLGDAYLDWRRVGFASPPSVEGDRAYTLTNRGEVVCLDMNGLADGNAGPFTDEGAHMTPRAAAATRPVAAAANDADIVWVCDLVAQMGVRTHDQVQGSVLVHGDLLYVNTCNGVDGTHRNIPSPAAPSLVVLDKRTGRLVARDGLRLGPNTFHVNWSSPSLGGIGENARIFFGGGDGVCY